MKNLKDILAMISIIVLILMLGNKNFTIRLLGGYTVQNKIVTIDSTFVKGKIDTLEVFNHYVETNGVILNPEPIVKYKYRYIKDKKVKIDSTKHFKVAVKDSLIDGSINIINKYNGNLVFADLTYKPLFPKLIKRTDTIKISTKETITLNRTKLGLGFGIDNHRIPSVLGGITFKNDYQLLYEFSNEPILGNTHSLKVIKNF